MWYAIDRLVRLIPFHDIQAGSWGRADKKGGRTLERSLCSSNLSRVNFSTVISSKLIFSNGGRIALGSDFPVESIDPLKGFYAAVTRLSEDGRSPHGPEGWFSQMKLSREEALRGMTIDGTSLFLQGRNDTDGKRRMLLTPT
jgi:predicted amidohydrolase YtcJ